MANVATAMIGVNLKFRNGTEVNLYEGDKITGLTFELNNLSRTIDGTLRVINVNTRANTKRPAGCPPESYINKIAQVSELIVDISEQYDAELVRIDPDSILEIGTVNGKMPGVATVIPDVELKLVYDQTSYDNAVTSGVLDPKKLSYSADLTANPVAVLKFIPGNISESITVEDFALTIDNTKTNIYINDAEDISAWDDNKHTFGPDENSYTLIVNLFKPTVSPETVNYMDGVTIRNGSRMVAVALLNDIYATSTSERYLGKVVG